MAEGTVAVRVAPRKPLGLFLDYVNDRQLTAALLQHGFFYTQVCASACVCVSVSVYVSGFVFGHVHVLLCYASECMRGYICGMEFGLWCFESVDAQVLISRSLLHFLL